MKVILYLFLLLSAALIHPSALRSQKIFNLRDFAKGDSDETGAIQEAINKAAGGTLVIPNDTFHAYTLYGVSKLKMVGEGAAMLQVKNFQLLNVDGFSAENIIFEGNIIKEHSNTLFQIISSKNVVLKKCVFQNNIAEGIAAKLSSKCSILYNKIINTDVSFFGVGGNSDFEIAYNEVRGGTSDGVCAWGFSKDLIDSNFIIHHNRVYNKPKGSGTLIRYSKNINAYDNYAENCSVGFGHDEQNDYSPSGIKIVHNTYKNCRVAISAAISNSFVQKNTIDSTVENAMTIGSMIGNTTNTFNVLVEDNFVVNATDGIRFSYAKNCVANNNTIVDTRENKITYDGIVVLFGDNNKIINNTCPTAQFPFLVNNAANTFFFANKGAIGDYKGTATFQLSNAK